MHLLRPARRGKNVPAEPARSPYAGGHFTALLRRHQWPPCFEPQFKSTREVEQSEISRINRERRVALGDTGTILGLSDRSDEMIRKRRIAQRAVR
jgi:hypothetical protein